jgi:hypothetical protein
MQQLWCRKLQLQLQETQAARLDARFTWQIYFHALCARWATTLRFPKLASLKNSQLLLLKTAKFSLLL